MAGASLKSGDSVVYHDRDHVRWGPWQVVAVEGDLATVLIEHQVSYSMPTGSLRKVLQETASD